MLKSICHLSTHGYFDPVPEPGRTDTGGQVVYVLELAKAMSKKGIKVDIYTRWFDGEKARVDVVPGFSDVRVIRIPAGKMEFVRKEEIYNVLPELSKNMIDFIVDNKLGYELFHGHYVDAGIVAMEVSKAFSKPCFFTPHSLGAWKRQKMGGDPEKMEKLFNFEHRIEEETKLFHSVTAQTLTTTLQKDKIEELYGFTADNMEVIAPGVDIQRFSPDDKNDRKLLPELPERYLFCLSRIDSNKGHDYLLYAFDRLRRELPDVHLIVGGGSKKPGGVELSVKTAMKKIIDDLDMSRWVTITGYIPNNHLPAYYRQAEAFILPSKFEPFGMTAFEAMSTGTPVVASRLGGIRELISSGKNGILVDPSDIDDFAGGLLYGLTNPRKMKRIGLAGRRYVLKEYGWDSIAKKFIRFYQKNM